MLCLMVSFLFLVFLGIFLRRVSSFASPFHPFFLPFGVFVRRIWCLCSLFGVRCSVLSARCSCLVVDARRWNSVFVVHCWCSRLGAHIRVCGFCVHVLVFGFRHSVCGIELNAHCSASSSPLLTRFFGFDSRLCLWLT